MNDDDLEKLLEDSGIHADGSVTLDPDPEWWNVIGKMTRETERAAKFWAEGTQRDDHGRWTEGGGGDEPSGSGPPGSAPGGSPGSSGSGLSEPSIRSERAQRALSSHKPATKEKQRIARENEWLVADMTKGDHTDDNDPTDVTLMVGSRFTGIEVKTIVKGTNDKITMHPKSLARKIKWGEDNGARLITVVFDHRAGNRMYFRSGVGSFRLSAMTPVRNAAHLRQLLRARGS